MMSTKHGKPGNGMVFTHPYPIRDLSFEIHSVIFREELMPCIDAIRLVSKGNENINAVFGHKLNFNDALSLKPDMRRGDDLEKSRVTIDVDSTVKDIFYVPFLQKKAPDYNNPGNLGKVGLQSHTHYIQEMVPV